MVGGGFARSISLTHGGQGKIDESGVRQDGKRGFRGTILAMIWGLELASQRAGTPGCGRFSGNDNVAHLHTGDSPKGGCVRDLTGWDHPSQKGWSRSVLVTHIHDV